MNKDKTSIFKQNLKDKNIKIISMLMGNNI